MEAFAGGGINTVLIWPVNGKAEFFKDDQYIQYDIQKDKADRGYPKPIQGNWPGLEKYLRTGKNVIVIWPNAKVYIFTGDQYLQYDIEKGRVDRGYPKPIRGNWPGLEPFIDIE